MNWWLLGTFLYLIAGLCVVGFVRAVHHFDPPRGKWVLFIMLLWPWLLWQNWRDDT